MSTKLIDLVTIRTSTLHILRPPSSEGPLLVEGFSVILIRLNLLVQRLSFEFVGKQHWCLFTVALYIFLIILSLVVYFNMKNIVLLKVE